MKIFESIKSLFNKNDQEEKIIEKGTSGGRHKIRRQEDRGARRRSKADMARKGVGKTRFDRRWFRKRRRTRGRKPCRNAEGGAWDRFARSRNAGRRFSFTGSAGARKDCFFGDP